VLVNAPDLSKFPQTAALDPATRSALRARIQEHNFALLLEAQRARSAFPGLDVRVADLFRCFDVVHARAIEFGFTKTDVAAWHDDSLPDKSFQGPGSHYLFWDNVQPSSVFHALIAQSIEADLTTTRVELIRHAAGSVLSIQHLRLGRNYCIERSVDLNEWFEEVCFQAIDFSHSQPPARDGSPSAFFRVVLGP
jgi:phospholipase/lecithinase/hemolysin